MARFSTQNHRIGCVKMPSDRITNGPVKVVKAANLHGACDRPLEELGEVQVLQHLPEWKVTSPTPTEYSMV